MGLVPADKTATRTRDGYDLRMIAGFVTFVFLIGLATHSAPPVAARDGSANTTQLKRSMARRYARSPGESIGGRRDGRGQR